MAMGTLSGALLAAGQSKPRFASLLMGAGVFGVGCTLAALAPGYWWFAATLVVIGAGALTFTNGTNSVMQLTTEPAMRGRVMALRVAIALGGTPIGAPIVGWVANHFGPRYALGIGAAGGLAAAMVAFFVLAPAAFVEERTGQLPYSHSGETSEHEELVRCEGGE
jgi:MFS family permease